MNRARRSAGKVHIGSYGLSGLVVACALAAALLFWLKPSRSDALKPNEAVVQYTLQLSDPISPATAGTIVAISDGIFAQVGLNIRVHSGSLDNDAIAAVVADENTIGLASTGGFLKARSEGLPIVAFAGSFAVSSVQFFTLPDTALLKPSDLEGKRIGYKDGPELSAVFYEFVRKNSLAQSRIVLIESGAALQDLLDRKIDVLLGRADVEGQQLSQLNIDYRTLSPDGYGVHAPGPVYFVQERALAKRRNLEKFITGTAEGWSAAYAAYGRTIPIIANSTSPRLPIALTSRLMDNQRRFLRPFGTRFGELDEQRIRVLASQLLLRRIIQEPVDLNRAINYDVLKEAYRKEARNLDRSEP
ncbi:ABC transporter substrate-binding protein [Bradyrhizobium sp. RT5a]|uniref:ABC transporter substrate-binding protein n=1 Tax=Bradyrhizobium sp. RT5a TaxID=3156380 RepID=UPI003398A44B